ncbi:neutral zinc metallopeptidase [Neptunomonas phycophila]|uniref:KPN_02809 family neutral zinc metallopeptidase n=1 Tax=Neptunomonas phycophila TaxID=1572645 RepID=UPI0026E20292|nr:neutral zinc metallopeptidase [Neptunomonas phycophila]MDO6785241.1 neutral zinc metallopeptidase [Neptunomonas phycophila]
MRWKSGRRSSNIDDRRSASGQVSSGRGFRMSGAKKGGGIGLVIMVGVVLLMGGDLNTVLGLLMGNSGIPTQTQTTNTQSYPTQTSSAEDNQMADFVSVVLADTEDTWVPLFTQMGKRYEEPTLVLFRNVVQSACGTAQSAMGPFYCPGDQRVYIDLDFYNELKDSFGAPGDFAQAYVIAHEVGHHVQQQFGILQKSHQMKQSMSQTQANALQVKVELQADCFAGIWAHYADKERAVVESGDIEEAMNAASQIGDDAIQKRAQGYAVPDSFTHGTSRQRMKWFNQGFTSGDVQSCNTFI